MKEKLFSVTADDCEWQYFRSGGKGGQNQNKVNSGCRVIHKPSGAVGESREHRDQLHNRRAAFSRMANSIAMRRWISMRVEECKMGKSVEQYVEEQLAPSKLKIEIQKAGKWIEARPEQLSD